MQVAEFIKKWSKSQLSERAASQEHFLDLCRLLAVKTPAEIDPTGDTFTFEKGARVSAPASAGSKGDRGWADVWYKGRFAWEYKRKDKHKTLAAAYQQLQQYREDLENPPLLIVCDIARFEIHTNFTGYKPEVHEIALEELADEGKLTLLRRVFTDPESFKPTETVAAITEKIAAKIGTIAQALRDRGHDPHEAAHFLMKVMFCLFAEDVELLPKGLFQTILTKSKDDPERLKKQMDALFDAMRTGGDFGVDEIAYFNGGLFDDAQAIELTETEAEILLDAAIQDWSAIEPSILGTLFERSLDPSKRSQIGAHYTSREDIMLVVEPVIVRPLRRAWEETKTQVEDQLERRRKSKTSATKKKADDAIADLLDGYLARLSSVKVLDPACGSGNFLYVAIQQLLLLEKEVITYASREEFGRGGLIPRVRPTQLLGIEINPYASELAQVSIWIGYLQWMRDNGFNAPRDPILEPITTIENRDAILAWADEDGEKIPVWREGAKCLGQAKWPQADFIVGNPPFLGGSLIWEGLGTEYRDALWSNYDIANSSDLCCYWFSRALGQVTQEQAIGLPRAGLLATQGIRGQINRSVLAKIVASAAIFEAWADRKWVLEGAAVHVSIVCFDDGTEGYIKLNGESCIGEIHSNLTAGLNLISSKKICENEGVCFIGTKKAGSFDIEFQQAKIWLESPINPNGRMNSEILRPWINGSSALTRKLPKWIIDFDERSYEQSAGYEAVFEYCRSVVKPQRDVNKEARTRENWWKHKRSAMDMKEAIRASSLYVLTPRIAKHRIFVHIASSVQPDDGVYIFARSDDYFFGVLHSSVHELWARRQGTQLREAESGFRYTPTTCFETFPLPWSPGHEPGTGEPLRPLHDAIGDAAADLNTQRERWLNPPEWVEPIAAQIDAEDDFADVARVSGDEARRLIRQSAIDAACAKDPKLKKRTLTNLYNERPTWLKLAHHRLDQAVLNAYAAIDPEGAWDPSWADVFVDTGAGQPLPEDHALREHREEVEQLILANLLRLNLQRAGEA
jgi:type II restriction/modification system DNA methylase subunit YeeA